MPAELLYRIGKGEKLGSGIGRMQAPMDEWKLPAPRFDVSSDSFSISLRTAQKDLGILAENGLVSREGQGKNTRYRFR